MSDWVKTGDKLPRDGKAVDIRLGSGQIVGNVLFENGRFWKKRVGPNAGHTWSAVEWRYPEKKGATDGKERSVETQAAGDPESIV